MHCTHLRFIFRSTCELNVVHLIYLQLFNIASTEKCCSIIVFLEFIASYSKVKICESQFIVPQMLQYIYDK